MSTPRPTLHAASALLLAAALLAACMPGAGTPPPPGDAPTATPTQNMATGYAGFGKVRYTYTIDGGDAYQMRIEQEIPFEIWLDSNEPKAQTIITGTAEGQEVVTIMGLDAGVPCFVTFTFGVTFNINGVFTPEDFCNVTLNISGVSAPERISKTMTCSANDVDGATLFIAPHSGPFEMRSPYPAVEQHPFNAQNTVIVELLQLVTPPDVGCSYNP